ncbi:SH3 domain protein [Alteromonas sp. KUL156]|uniref:TIGR04211 family SH3 domain-containing protein n=1 Tax=Alteromonas sp. KUL106 TaxID=2480799 RepID=UPI0012E4ADF7|nr:TIGR04211 family SH3 domain-containing protein [Alteromonas sp. KUL106]GFD67607.1 SH3 domain protein [Alteromonas sp. KUL106]GFD77839.1 SH3 domain protein [Tenacibaculum sp. KUL118]GFD92374.1 SH3 domain protein [Alteromonas sp. KUL154]GFD98873.1 SH3 domain protein [Alteromonas sp. KUL156]
MIRKWLAAALIACSFQAFSLQDTADLEASSSHYIRDDLFIFMHTGPGRNYRILGSIEAGTPITVLSRDNDAEFTQITDNEGRSGWVESKFVSNTMSRAEQLPIISEKLAESQSGLQSAQSENAKLRQQLSEARQQVSRLTTTNDEQASQIIRLTAQVESASKDELVTWFTRGGMVAGIGILLGVLITYLPKRKRRNSEWM